MQGVSDQNKQNRGHVKWPQATGSRCYVTQLHEYVSLNTLVMEAFHYFFFVNEMSSHTNTHTHTHTHVASPIVSYCQLFLLDHHGFAVCLTTILVYPSAQ